MRERGVSVVVNYIATLGILTILVTSLFLGMSAFVQTQHEQTIRAELDVVSNRVAAQLGTADRLAQAASASGAVRLETDLPDRVAGARYRIEISEEDAGLYEISVYSFDPAVVVTERARLRSSFAEETVDGGRLAFRYESDTVVVESA